MNTADEESDKSNEPELGYNNRIIFFSSIEEKNEYDFKEMAAFSPAESLSHVTSMRLLQFPHLNTSQDPFGDIVYFD